MTDENWPIIGPMNSSNAYVVGALSGFGVMAACAAGELCASHVSGETLPHYAAQLSLDRYNDAKFVQDLKLLADKSLL